mmetsp:Transcript_16326/g.57018  ORF Transcript_16326/g.57018 Transcript_16326/m.57018 type:complete len:593 (+) Transcript_16326:56-1834(+)
MNAADGWPGCGPAPSFQALGVRRHAELEALQRRSVALALRNRELQFWGLIREAEELALSLDVSGAATTSSSSSSTASTTRDDGGDLGSSPGGPFPFSSVLLLWSASWPCDGQTSQQPPPDGADIGAQGTLAEDAEPATVVRCLDLPKDCERKDGTPFGSALHGSPTGSPMRRRGAGGSLSSVAGSPQKGQGSTSMTSLHPQPATTAAAAGASSKPAPVSLSPGKSRCRKMLSPPGAKSTGALHSLLTKSRGSLLSPSASCSRLPGGFQRPEQDVSGMEIVGGAGGTPSCRRLSTPMLRSRSPSFSPAVGGVLQRVNIILPALQGLEALAPEALCFSAESLLLAGLPPENIQDLRSSVIGDAGLKGNFLAKYQEEGAEPFRISIAWHLAGSAEAADAIEAGGICCDDGHCACGRYGRGGYVATTVAKANAYADSDGFGGDRHMFLVLILPDDTLIRGERGSRPSGTAVDLPSHPTEYCFVDPDRLYCLCRLDYNWVPTGRRPKVNTSHSQVRAWRSASVALAQTPASPSGHPTPQFLPRNRRASTPQFPLRGGSLVSPCRRQRSVGDSPKKRTFTAEDMSSSSGADGQEVSDK